MRDFHVDGLRLDAIHAIYDTGAVPIMAQLADRVHAARPGALVIAESGLNDPKVIRPRELGGFGHDAQWADDFHHALRVLLTGDRGGYYEEFGAVADLAKAFARPFVHDGQYSTFRKRRFGAPAADRPPQQFVVFDQNHDQVGNRAFGDRLPARGPPARRVRHAAVAVRADAVHGRGVRRAGAVSVLLATTSTRRSPPPRATGAGASSPPSPSSPGRRCPIRRTRRRSSAPSSPASATRSSRTCSPDCCAFATNCPTRRP